MASFIYLFFIHTVLSSICFAQNSAAVAKNSSDTRASYIFYLDSDGPSTWYNNNSVVFDGWKMRVFLLIQEDVGFYCGFYCTGKCNSYLFSVVAVGGGNHGLVWSPNRDYPLRENATVQLSTDGNLILRDSDGRKVWSSNTSGKSVAGMNLTEAGNLVLFNNGGVTVWQSFDHPMDTLLVGQRLYVGQKLIAGSFNNKWSEGPYYGRVASDANFAAFVSVRQGESLMYYLLLANQSSVNSTGLHFERNESLVNLGIPLANPRKSSLSYIQYLRLDTDGHLRMYQHNGTAFEILFDMVTKGCLLSPSQHDLTEVSDFTYFDVFNSEAAFPNFSLEGCRQACLQNCSCTTAFFGYERNVSEGYCFMPFLDSWTAEEQLNSNKDFKLATFIKVRIPYVAEASPPIPSSRNQINSAPLPAPEEATTPEASPPIPPSRNQTNSAPSPARDERTIPGASPPAPTSRKQKDLVAIIAGSGASAFFIILLFFLVILCKSNAKKDGDDYINQFPGMLLRFSYEELRVATEDFKDLLGGGGFGSVFKGMLKEGSRIAVKRLDRRGQGLREFLAEVEIIGSIHHFNLVRLMGFCAEKSSRLLVYEYMSNGSLDSWIFHGDRKSCLDWHTRKKIILDIAKGLAYLHEDCRQRIAHLDIKPQNILLDENFNAKVSDFGLSKLIDRDKSQVQTTMRGTPGYLAPEWRQSRITTKVDIYSFGIVVLETVCGRRNLDRSQSESSSHLLGLLQRKAEEDRLIEIVENFDEHMRNHEEEVVRMIRLGAWCLQNDPARRPLMSTVVKVLEGVMDVDPNIIYKFAHALAPPPPDSEQVLTVPQASILSTPR